MAETHTDQPQEWTLQTNGLVVRRGDFIECQIDHHLRAAMVISVDICSLSTGKWVKGEQVIAVRVVTGQRLPKADALANFTVAGSSVTRKIKRGEALPALPEKAKTLFSPFSDENPWKLDTFMNVAEWKEVSRWYSFSLRELLLDGHWYECGRFPSRNSAYQVMKALDARRAGDYFVIVQCTLVGNDGREKAVVFHGGSQQSILAERQARRAGKRL